jgi:RNA polymerase sigma-70 factor (ECF subfamily)
MTVLAQVILDKSSTTPDSSMRYIDARAVAAADGEATAIARPARDRLPANSLRRKQAQPIPGEIKASFRAATLATIPQLRAFAFSLSRDIDRADDLVQETLLRAFINWRRLEPGSNLQAWLITILRNAFYSEERSRRREWEDGDRIYAETLVVPAEQASRRECEEFSEALGRLPDKMREVVLLIGAYGFSYREAASLCDCAVGTIKSRVNRPRTCLILRRCCRSNLRAISSRMRFPRPWPSGPSRAGPGAHKRAGYGMNRQALPTRGRAGIRNEGWRRVN